MPTLTIDEREVSVPAGASVLEAAEALGITVPHFCYHKALGAVGACRLCAVEIQAGPQHGLRMACLVEARDGMVVSTTAPAATGMRRAVIEYLMLNHPHDCPVCDEGGECQLQDMTVAGGHGVRRYRGKKRTFPNQELGPFVEQEMNRCIQCYRCVRTYRDYAGGHDFGVLGVRQRVAYGRFRPGRLESPYSGNLVDVCPTGVFTDKTVRFRARVWDMQCAPSVCPHCSLGCATWPWARYRELLRVSGREGPRTNGFFLCDRGRFGSGHANHPDRPRTPRLDGRELGWPEALEALRERLTKLTWAHGPGAVGLLTSGRASLESARALGLLGQALGGAPVVCEPHPRRDRAVRALVAELGQLGRDQEDVRQSDCLLLAGLDPEGEAPMLALAARQAVRRGARAAVWDPRPDRLPFPARRIARLPEALLEALARPDGRAPDGLEAAERESYAETRAALQAAERPVLLGGADLLGPRGVRLLLAAARALSRPGRACGLSLALPGPDSFGGALLCPDGPDADELLAGIEAGRVRALVCLEADPLSEHPDPARVAAALGRLELLVVLDHLPTASAARAHAVLPTTAAAEMDGAFVNHAGRLQGFARVYSAGLPIRVTGQGAHPPREFRPDTPGELPQPGWAVLAALAGEPVELGELRAELARSEPRLAGLAGLVAGGPGVQLALEPSARERPDTPAEPGVAEGELALLSVEALFGSEPLSARAAPVAGVASEDALALCPADAARLGLGEGEPARLRSALGEAVLPVRLAPGLAPGFALVQRRFGGPLEGFAPGGGPIACRIEKGGAR
ncbi:MAG TPA: NADH-quinone oxidoreductase subunit NuoG [Myxococcota bacterium]|nr:NADH-quinone oxidoreductase subunit NuoG [Myxococcota bacterium]HRY92722.1 NADH-quinone oxidoreductase subunit NuoG [Myxococcota bacterium]